MFSLMISSKSGFKFQAVMILLRYNRRLFSSHETERSIAINIDEKSALERARSFNINDCEI